MVFILLGWLRGRWPWSRLWLYSDPVEAVFRYLIWVEMKSCGPCAPLPPLAFHFVVSPVIIMSFGVTVEVVEVVEVVVHEELVVVVVFVLIVIVTVCLKCG